MLSPSYIEAIRPEKAGYLLFYPVSFPDANKSKLERFSVEFDEQFVKLRI